MMRTKKYLMPAMIGLTLMACGNPETAVQEEKPVAEEATETSYTVDPAASTVTWQGVMLGVKQHSGTVKVQEGKLNVKGGSVIGGTVSVDMSRIEATDDWTYTEDYSREKLAGHLSSPDFFDVASHPVATVKLTGQTGDVIDCELTVRGVTNKEQITNVQISETNGTLKASGDLTFDRQKYNVAWSSGSADMVLSDDIELNVELIGSAK